QQRSRLSLPPVIAVPVTERAFERIARRVLGVGSVTEAVRGVRVDAPDQRLRVCKWVSRKHARRLRVRLSSRVSPRIQLICTSEGMLRFAARCRRVEIEPELPFLRILRECAPERRGGGCDVPLLKLRLPEEIRCVGRPGGPVRCPPRLGG